MKCHISFRETITTVYLYFYLNCLSSVKQSYYLLLWPFKRKQANETCLEWDFCAGAVYLNPKIAFLEAALFCSFPIMFKYIQWKC